MASISSSMDALSSAVAMKVDCDLQLTLMASSLYRLLALKVQNGYRQARSRDFFSQISWMLQPWSPSESCTLRFTFRSVLTIPCCWRLEFHRMNQRDRLARGQTSSFGLRIELRGVNSIG